MVRFLSALCLRLVGWKVVGELPPEPKLVLVGAPHTSNWDLPLYILMAGVLGFPLSWMGKHTLFRGPAGPLMRALGGIPIYRHRHDNVVGQMSRAFAERDRLVLAITAEGTRSRAEFWKSGFYHIAERARVPVLLGFADYARKECGVGPVMIPSGDVRADMQILRDFFRDKVGKYPQNFSPVRLREEES